MNSARDTLAGGLPHSEIPGSPIARISPGLFAACRVLHRLSVPRHPPDALVSLGSTPKGGASEAVPPRLFSQGRRPARRRARRPFRRAQRQAPPAPWRRPERIDPKGPARGDTAAQPFPEDTFRTEYRSRARRRCGGPSASVTFANSLHPFQSAPPAHRRALRPARPQANRQFAKGHHRTPPSGRPDAGPPPDTGDATAVQVKGAVEVNGIEPMTSCLQSRRSPN